MGSSKVVSLSEAVADIPDRANLTFGGFAAYFTPLALVRELIRQGKRELKMTSVGECEDCWDMFWRGITDWGFVSSAEVDPRGVWLQVKVL